MNVTAARRAVREMVTGSISLSRKTAVGLNRPMPPCFSVHQQRKEGHHDKPVTDLARREPRSRQRPCGGIGRHIACGKLAISRNRSHVVRETLIAGSTPVMVTYENLVLTEKRR